MAEKYNPNVPPPAPQPTVNPYGFIMSPGQTPQKKSALILGPNDSFVKKLALILGGAAILIVVLLVASSLFLGGKSNTDLLVSVAQDQQEIIRINSSTGTQVNATALKNFAVTAEATMGSDQQKLLAHITSLGGSVDQKILALKADAASDALLTTAKSTNTLDASYAQLMQALLTTYRTNIETAFEASGNEAVKQDLRKAYASSELLLQQLAKYTS
jgi:hypothetical protein